MTGLLCTKTETEENKMIKMDIENVNQNIERIEKQSLKSLSKQTTLKTTKRSQQKQLMTRSIILADISGSMRGNKITGLRKALHDIWSHGIECIAFEAELWEVTQNDISNLQPLGGTHMLEALREGWNKKTPHIILITDGQPTDAEDDDILREVYRHREVVIDTIGLGDYGTHDYNPDLLRQIAETTGGRFIDVGEPIKLTNTLQFLLEYRQTSLSQGGSGSSTSGAIQL